MNTTEEATTTRPVKVLYTAKTHTTGGREGGASRASDGRLDVKLSVPGAPGNGTNPEQLFAVGWTSQRKHGRSVQRSRSRVFGSTNNDGKTRTGK